ncbi:MAG: HAD-IB family phosphatase [Rhabdochlamydiaceae bacterium]|jgi:HAD superfamily hydrolase (TIGR01490 family)
MLKLAAFDLDKTLLASNSSYEFCRHLYKCKIISFKQLLCCAAYRIGHELSFLSIEELHDKVFKKILLGLPLTTLKKQVPSFLENFLFSSLYLPTVAELFKAQKRGDYTVILSNSPDFLVEPIAQFFQVDEWGATKYTVDKDRRLCKIAKLMEGRNKAAYLLELAIHFQISKDAITAYSDSYHDLPFLLEAGCPIAVNPDRKLLKIARLRKWSVI